MEENNNKESLNDKNIKLYTLINYSLLVFLILINSLLTKMNLSEAKSLIVLIILIAVGIPTLIFYPFALREIYGGVLW